MRSLRQVLAATYAIVPTGELAEDVIDAELAALLGGEAHDDEPADPAERRR